MEEQTKKVVIEVVTKKDKEKPARVLLDKATVIAIKNDPSPMLEIAARYSVEYHVVADIKLGRSYVNVGGTNIVAPKKLTGGDRPDSLLNNEQRRQLVALRAGGKSWEQIGKFFGITRDRARKVYDSEKKLMKTRG